jgi:hypothetical protein
MIVWETLYPGERATELQAVAHPERLRDVGVACANGTARPIVQLRRC